MEGIVREQSIRISPVQAPIPVLVREVGGTKSQKRSPLFYENPIHGLFPGLMVLAYFKGTKRAQRGDSVCPGTAFWMRKRENTGFGESGKYPEHNQPGIRADPPLLMRGNPREKKRLLA